MYTRTPVARTAFPIPAVPPTPRGLRACCLSRLALWLWPVPFSDLCFRGWGLRSGWVRYDDAGRPTLRSPTIFYRHDSEEELLDKLQGTKPVPVLSPVQYRKLRGMEAKLQKPDNEEEKAKAKRRLKKGAGAVAMRAKLATLKFVRQLFGKHVASFAARNIVAEMRWVPGAWALEWF